MSSVSVPAVTSTAVDPADTVLFLALTVYSVLLPVLVLVTRVLLPAFTELVSSVSASCEKFTASLASVPLVTLVIFWLPASKPLAETLPAKVGASNSCTSTWLSVTTVLTLSLRAAAPALAPPLIAMVLPNFFWAPSLPVSFNLLPVKVIVRLTATSKVFKAPATVLLVVVSPAWGLLVRV